MPTMRKEVTYYQAKLIRDGLALLAARIGEDDLASIGFLELDLANIVEELSNISELIALFQEPTKKSTQDNHD